MALSFFEKQPGESYTIGVDFVNRLPSGASVSSGTVAGYDTFLSATDNTVIASTTATISGTQAKVKVQAGTSGKRYRITFSVTLSNTDVLIEEVWMDVLDR